MQWTRPALLDLPSQSRLDIDLGALVANWKTMAAMAGGVETGAAVKADAYGIGIAMAGPALAAAGCRTFFVALAQEGAALRRLVPEAVIYVLNGLPAGAAPVFSALGLRPVLNSMAEIDSWRRFRSDGGTGEAAIHIDTGMNRLGLTAEEAAALGSVDGIALVMSHLACADEPFHSLNRRQLERFRAVAPHFPGVPLSLANSGGIALGADFHFDLVRPGIALYGGRFVAGRPPLRTVVTASAAVLMIRDAPAGAAIGYGAARTLRRPSRIAILAAGYADGYPRAASSTDDRDGAAVLIRGRLAPLLGRVSMDLSAVDVTDIPGVAAGDFAELFGENVAAHDVALTAGTVDYELLTSLGSRYARHYRGGG